MGYTGEKEPLIINSTNQTTVTTIPRDNSTIPPYISIIDICQASVKHFILYKGELKTIFIISQNLVIEKYSVKNLKEGFIKYNRLSDEYPLIFSNSIPKEEYISIIENFRKKGSVKIKKEIKSLNLKYADRNIQFKPSFVFHGKGAFSLKLKIYHPIFSSQINNDDHVSNYCFMNKHQFEPKFGTFYRDSIVGVKNIYPNQLSPFISPEEYSSMVDSFNNSNRKRRLLGNINIIIFLLLFIPSLIGLIIAIKFYTQTVYPAIITPICLISGILGPFAIPLLLNRMLKSEITEMVIKNNILYSSRNIRVVHSNLEKNKLKSVRLFIFYPRNNENNIIASTNVQPISK